MKQFLDKRENGISILRFYRRPKIVNVFITPLVPFVGLHGWRWLLSIRWHVCSIACSFLWNIGFLLCYQPNSDHKSFINSVQNVRNTLGSLERSIGKSKEYEQKLLQCRGSHSHSHGANEWWDSDHSEEKSFKCNTTSKFSMSLLLWK